MERVYAFLAQGRWFRLTSKLGVFCLGDQRYNASTQFATQTLEITFDPQTCELICLPQKSCQTFRLKVKSLTPAALMGELDPLVTLPAYQLALPFTPQTWRETLLCQSLADTTL